MSSLTVAEPRAAYADRPKLVIDASVLAAALFAEAGGDDALSWMRGRALCAPHLVDCEIANVALVKIQRNVLQMEAAIEALQLLSDLDIQRYAIEPGAVLALAARVRLTAYDAAYLWLADTLKAPLATLDSKLGAAALAYLRDER